VIVNKVIEEKECEIKSVKTIVNISKMLPQQVHSVQNEIQLLTRAVLSSEKDEQSLQQSLQQKHKLSRLQLQQHSHQLLYLSHNMKTWEDAEAQQKIDEAGKDEKDQTKIRLDVLFKITNLNKQIILNSHVCNRKIPLLSSFYKTNSLLPIFEHFFKNDYESGKIPKLTDDLKLYFSTPHVLDGKWIQFHGPGSIFDKNGMLSCGDDDGYNQIVLSPFSLCDFNKKKRSQSRTDRDRCELTPNECKKQHKSTDTNYPSYHAPPNKQYTSDFVINVKWEKQNTD
jgi:hypothetical protein